MQSVVRKFPDREGKYDLSICVAIKNRSKVHRRSLVLNLFPLCIESIVKSAPSFDGSIELVVADYSSDDLPLSDWLHKAVNGFVLKIETLSKEKPFSRGEGLNTAARASSGKTLFFLDADMIVCPAVLQRAREVAEKGEAYFPICWSFKTPDHNSGWWRKSGFGNCALSYKVFQSVGGWDQFPTWGAEDALLRKRVENKTSIVREEVDGFQHQWHPNGLTWKNQHAS